MSSNRNETKVSRQHDTTHDYTLGDISSWLFFHARRFFATREPGEIDATGEASGRHLAKEHSAKIIPRRGANRVRSLTSWLTTKARTLNSQPLISFPPLCRLRARNRRHGVSSARSSARPRNYRRETRAG